MRKFISVILVLISAAFACSAAADPVYCVQCGTVHEPEIYLEASNYFFPEGNAETFPVTHLYATYSGFICAEVFGGMTALVSADFLTETNSETFLGIYINKNSHAIPLTSKYMGGKRLGEIQPYGEISVCSIINGFARLSGGEWIDLSSFVKK